MDSKISALTTKYPVALTDYMVIVDNTSTPPETKKCTVAQFLVSMNIKTGYNGSSAVAVNWAVVFPSALGADTDGKDYDLIISCTDSHESTEQLGYAITNRTENGFTITPVAAAWIEYTAISI